MFCTDKITETNRQLKHFQAKDLIQPKKFLGIEIERERSGRKMFIRVHQKSDVKKLIKRFNMENCYAVETPMKTIQNEKKKNEKRSWKGWDGHIYKVSKISRESNFSSNTWRDLLYAVT